MKTLELKKRYSTRELEKFAGYMQRISDEIGFKVSSRGWCYILEGHGLINKNQFNKVEELINNCRRKGFLPIDFVAEEKARQFDGIEVKTEGSVVGLFGAYLAASINADQYYTPDWWDGEEYYIQMIVEKVDLVELFGPVCQDYHIPIANTKGWSSMSQRAEYARRFSEARDRGLQCVLLYCGDHDPDGLRISEFMRKNLEDLKDITWEDGTTGYDPENLIIERFGLNYDFIIQQGLTWIDNLVTSGGTLAELKNGKIVPGRTNGGKEHPNYRLEYLQRYLKDVGVRKCEANAIVVRPEAARQLVRDVIEKYVSADALKRFAAKRRLIRQELNNFLTVNRFAGTLDSINEAVKQYEIDNENE